MTRAVEQDLLIALAVLLFADELECVTQGLNRGLDRGLDVPTCELEAVDFALHVLEACLGLIQEQLRSHLGFANDAVGLLLSSGLDVVGQPLGSGQRGSQLLLMLAMFLNTASRRATA